MEPDIWPLNPVSAAALVTRVIDDVDHTAEEERDELLSDLLSVTWGAIWAQNQ